MGSQVSYRCGMLVLSIEVVTNNRTELQMALNVRKAPAHFPRSSSCSVLPATFTASFAAYLWDQRLRQHRLWARRGSPARTFCRAIQRRACVLSLPLALSRSLSLATKAKPNCAGSRHGYSSGSSHALFAFRLLPVGRLVERSPGAPPVNLAKLLSRWYTPRRSAAAAANPTPPAAS